MKRKIKDTLERIIIVGIALILGQFFLKWIGIIKF